MRAWAGLLLTLLAGCACVPEPTSGAVPVELQHLAECTAEQSLAVDAACRFAVDARQYSTRLPVRIQSGQRYRLDVSPKQTWTDWNRPSDPRTGGDGNALMDLLTRCRRLPEQQWFVLGLAWRSCRPGGDQCGEQEARVVGDGLTVDVVDGRALVFFANDMPGFYWNNCGRVWLRLQRKASAG